MDLLDIRRQPTRHAAWLALALAATALQGCAEKPAAPMSHTRLFASDFQGAAKACTAPKVSLQPGKELVASMQLGNDGGWCAIHVARDDKPYAAGLLSQPPAHGKVYVHAVGDATRIDYTPDRGFAGADTFLVTLLPGSPTLRVNVAVTPH
jgi:hypothetical protein